MNIDLSCFDGVHLGSERATHPIAPPWPRLVTHPRIGDAARAAGFGAVHDTRPTLEAVAASIESLA